jgi:hypothetical protein
MNSNQTITVWKSDFKDFPFLYEATEWCIGAAIQKATNFVVIRGNNPYELRNEKRFTEKTVTYARCIELAREFRWEKKVVEMLHSFIYSPSQIFEIMCGKLNYPENHIKRQWT